MSLRGMLQRRNLKVLSANSGEHLIFPPKWPRRSEEQLYQLFHHYGFRTFLKDLILHRHAFTLKDLTRYCSEAAAREYLKKMVGLNLVRRQKTGEFRLKRYRTVFTLGETLEWYLAQLLQRELECDTLWNVVLGGLPSGGDYDVLAECENHLLYLEVKSSPPKTIELENVRAFLSRVHDLRPEIAIFFEDTTLRMKDKIVPHFEAMLGQHFGDGNQPPKKFSRLSGETFQCDGLFLTNSKPGILENIRLCLATFLREKGIFLRES